MEEFCINVPNTIRKGDSIDSQCVSTNSLNFFEGYDWSKSSLSTYTTVTNYDSNTLNVDMGKILYMYVSNGKTCVSNDVPVYKEDLSTFYHAHGSKVIYIEGTGLMELMCTLLKVQYSKSGFIKLSSDSIVPMLMAPTPAKELSSSWDKEVIPFSMEECNEESKIVFDSEFDRRR